MIIQAVVGELELTWLIAAYYTLSMCVASYPTTTTTQPSSIGEQAEPRANDLHTTFYFIRYKHRSTTTQRRIIITIQHTYTTRGVLFRGVT